MTELLRTRTAILAALTVLVLGIAAAAVALRARGGRAQPTTPQPTTPDQRTVGGSLFTTALDGSWHLRSRHNSTGAAMYQLSSTGAAANALGVPPAGTIAVTISVIPARLLPLYHLAGAMPDTSWATQNVLELLPNVVGTPGAATYVRRAGAPSRSSLAGAEAAIESYGYLYRGLGNIQVDLLARRAGNLILIELDTEPSLAREGEAAVQAIAQNWHWR